MHPSESKGSHTRRACQNHSHLVHKSTRSSTSIRQERRVRAIGGRSGLVRGASRGDSHSCICRIDGARGSSGWSHGGDGCHIAYHGRRGCHARDGCAEGDAVRGTKVLTVCKCSCGSYQSRFLSIPGSWLDLPAWSDAVQ